MQNQTPNNEKFLTKPLIIIFITVFIDLVGFGIVIPALPFYVESDLFAPRLSRSGFCLLPTR